MTAHTPGPWTIRHADTFSPDRIEGIYAGTPPLDEDGEPERWELPQIVVTDSGVYPPRLADARLIAAAPDLLAELKQLRANIEAEGWELAESPAIAKAEGRV